MQQRPTFATLSMVGLIGLLWGLNWPAVKFMLTEIPPLTLRASGFACAAVVLMGIARGLGHKLRPARGEGLSLLVTAFFILFGFNMLTAFGQLVTETSSAAIIAYTMPAMTAVLAGVFLGERVDARSVLAIGVGMAGLAVLASADVPALLRNPLGPAIMLLAALSWAIGNVSMQLQAWTLSPLARAAWFFVIATVLAWPLVLLLEPPWRLDWPGGPVLLTFAFHVAGPMVACYLLWTVLLGRLSATVAAISTLTAPVVGVLSAVVLLGDALTWQRGLALCLVVASIMLTLIHPPPKPGRVCAKKKA